MSKASRETWAVFNQSQSPMFQKLIDSLSQELGPCLVYTGTPFPSQFPELVNVEKGPSYNRATLATRILSWSAFAGAAASRLVRMPALPLALFVTNPPLLPHLAWATRAFKKLPYALLIWDIYPDHLVHSQIFSKQHPVVSAWRHLNRRSLLAAEQVITIGEVMGEAVEAQLGSGAQRLKRPLRVIPNWCEPDVLVPLSKESNPMALAHSQVGRTTVMYAGNMGATHQLSGLLGAAKLMASDPTVSFFLVGSGLGKGKLESDIQRQGLRNVTVLPPQSWADFPKMLALADVSVVCQSPGTESLSFPSKTYSALSVGSAILALTHPESDLGQLVRREEVGVVAPPNDAQAIADSLRGLMSNREQLDRMRLNARRIATKQFSSAQVESQWLDVLRPLVRANDSRR